MTENLALFCRRTDPDRFLTALFAPAARRDSLFALIAFNHELARAREVAREPMLAMIRLQWWRETVLGARRRHEVAGSLGAAIENGALDRAGLLAMIDAREAECDAAIEDMTAWRAYVDGTAGQFAVSAGRLLGAGPALLDRLRTLGTAVGVAGQIANLSAQALQSRCLLPVDRLAAHGLSSAMVIAEPGLARPVLDELAALGRTMLAETAGPWPRASIAAALPGVLAARDLRRGDRARGLAAKLAVVGAGLSGRI